MKREVEIVDELASHKGAKIWVLGPRGDKSSSSQAFTKPTKSCFYKGVCLKHKQFVGVLNSISHKVKKGSGLP